MKRRTRWRLWARSTAKQRRVIAARAAIRRRTGQWAIREGFVQQYSHREKPNPFYGWRSRA